MRRDHIGANLRTVSKIGLAIAMTAGSSAAVAQVANATVTSQEVV